MSIATALTALNADVEAAKAAITAKGGTAPIGTADMADAIDAIPSGGAEITDGIVIKARNTQNKPISIEHYGDVLLQQYGQYGGVYAGWDSVTDVVFHNVTRIEQYGLRGMKISGEFVFPYLTYYKSGIANNPNITKLSFPILENINGYSLTNMTSLTEVLIPHLKKIDGAGSFMTNNPALKIVEFGSVGFTVKSSYNTLTSIFTGCTQSDLTITVYTDGSYHGDSKASSIDNCIDYWLTAIRNGATNATIIIKASEDTTYNGVSYAAGETIITSEVA